MPQIIWTVTADDADGAGRPPEVFAAELREVLAPLGVTVELRPDMRGRGGLVGGIDPTMEVRIRQAVARVRTMGLEKVSEMNEDDRR